MHRADPKRPLVEPFQLTPGGRPPELGQQRYAFTASIADAPGRAQLTLNLCEAILEVRHAWPPAACAPVPSIAPRWSPPRAPSGRPEGRTPTSRRFPPTAH